MSKQGDLVVWLEDTLDASMDLEDRQRGECNPEGTKGSLIIEMTNGDKFRISFEPVD